MSNVLTWFEIPATNFDRAVAFYSTILDKELSTMDFMGVPNAMFPVDGTEQRFGAIIADSKHAPSASGTLVYFNVKDIGEVLERVEPAGGKIEMPATSIGDPGTIAIIHDTEGNRVGLNMLN